MAGTHTPGFRPTRPARSRRSRVLGTAGPVLLLLLGGGVVASAQSASPFASKKKRQAWEQPQAAQPAPAPTQSAPPRSAPAQYAPPQYTPPAATTPMPGIPARSYAAPAAAPRYGAVPQPSVAAEPAAGAIVDWSTYQPTLPAPAPAPSHNTLPEGFSAQPSAFAGTRSFAAEPTPAASNTGAAWPQYTPTPSGGAAGGGYPYGQAAGPGGYGDPAPAYGQAGPTAGPTTGPMAPAPRRSWKERLGLGNLATLITGGVRGGVAARDADGWEEAFVGDADVEAEVSAITDGGLEYGINLQARAQYDPARRGFVRRLPDCPPTLAGCASVLVNGVPVGLRGHTSQFYTTGPDVAQDTRVALESAHLFLRSAYGDVTVGRDDGAAYLFSLGAPSLLNVGASNSPVDYTGLDAVKTVNDASGFAEKITYTSPRLLGDRIGVGVQLGVSYAPDPNVCGVDYCVERGGITNVLTPDLEDVIEAGLSLDRTFGSGLSVEGTVTYARASETSGQAGFDDLSSVGAGVEVSLSDFTLGGSWLHSNQGLAMGDYEAWDVGLTWQRGALGATLGYGHAEDALVNLSSDQITAGITYDVSERVRLGAGVQHADRETLRAVGDVGGVAQRGGEKATALFIEGGITF